MTTHSGMLLIREKYVPTFLDISEIDEIRYTEALVTVPLMLMRMIIEKLILEIDLLKTRQLRTGLL